MIPPIDSLKTESDVEQKLIWTLLTGSFPEGLGFASSDILTKLSIRRLEIGKGSTRKLYYPDYVIVLAGLPLLVVEAKSVGESVEGALDEARLYANEINALYPHGINPCSRVVACNGECLWTSPVDSSTPDVRLAYSEFSSAGNIGFARFVDLCRRTRMQELADQIRRRIRKEVYTRPVNLLGGETFQSEELPQNTFGATIAGDYGHIFNPKSREDRAMVVEKAYVASLARQRYVEPIDRLIRNAVAPAAARITPLTNSSEPKEITAALRDRKRLENQVLLLIGSVGAGKSTFIDYLSEVALPKDLRDRTVWLRLNLNEAPLDIGLAYSWVSKNIIEGFREGFADVDFDKMFWLEKIFGRELSALKKGPLSVLDPASTEYQVRLADRVAQLQSDDLVLAKAIASYMCASFNRLLIVVLDNCDKRTRDEQLLMFQMAQWVKSEFKCLVILPLRDVTFDLHRHEPPLDTALKQFIFRIEPPPFSDVLQARVRLALDEIGRLASTARTLTYHLPNGMKVTYPAEDQALYLASIMRSLYAHDRFVRQVMTGLAGRDVRKALEIFLDFCMSGHIGEDQIYKIKFFEGQHVLPLSVVARVLLRMQRRYYDGKRSYLKNLVQCDPADPLPDHFVRLALLHWFDQKLRIKGPAGVEGFHRAADMVADLVTLGHDAERVRLELAYLVREGCLVAEHLRTDNISDADLLKLTASGVVHIQLMANPEYLAACAEDTWVSDTAFARRVAERLSKGVEAQFSLVSTAQNAKELVDYLMARWSESVGSPESYLEPTRLVFLRTLREAESGIAAAEIALPDRLFVGNLPFDTSEEELKRVFSARGIALRSATLPRERKANRNRGFAFIEPDSKRNVLECLALDGVLNIRGRRLRINEADALEEEDVRSGRAARATPTLTDRIYVAKLPYSFGKYEIRELFARFELTPIDIYLLMDKNAGRSRGAGFVQMRSIDDAASAIGSLNGLDVEGMKLLVRPADPREKG